MLIAVIANGEPVDKHILQRYALGAEVIIAADGGVNTCLAGGIKPDYVVGDMDSIDIDPSREFPQAVIERITDQDSTDLEKVLSFCRRFEPETIRFFSILGLRADHTMANMILIHDFDSGIALEVYDNHGKIIRLKPGKHRLKTETGKTVSLLSIHPVQNLTLKGFRYPLTEHSDPIDFFGISNVYESDECEISFDAGSILLYELY